MKYRITPVIASEVTLELVEDAIGKLTLWPHQCHAASLRLVKSGLLGPDARVARGFCPAVLGQHSWATIGDPYEKYAAVVDVTRWSYEDREPYVWLGTRDFGLYLPHGVGSYLDGGKPSRHDGDVIELTPSEPLSPSAKQFLRIIGPLDIRGWMEVAHMPVGGWPAAEVLAAMDDTKLLKALAPVDRLGMLTDRNPGGLYM